MTVSRVTRANGAPMVKTAKRKAAAVFGANGRGKPFRVEHKAVGGGVITKVTDRASGRVHLTAHTDNRGKVQRMLADGSMRPLAPAEVTRLPGKQPKPAKALALPPKVSDPGKLPFWHDDVPGKYRAAARSSDVYKAAVRAGYPHDTALSFAHRANVHGVKLGKPVEFVVYDSKGVAPEGYGQHSSRAAAVAHAREMGGPRTSMGIHVIGHDANGYPVERVPISKTQPRSISALGIAGTAASVIGAVHNFRAAKDAGDSKTMAAVKTAAPMAAGYLLGRAALPVFAAVSAAQHAYDDKSTARGAVRGLINAVDPTQLYTAFKADKRGFGQRAFDAKYGAAEHRPRGVPGVILGATAASPGDTYKSTWTDKNGVVRVRRDFSVRKEH